MTKHLFSFSGIINSLFLGLIAYQLLFCAFGLFNTFSGNGRYASGDFIEYWSAFVVTLSGANPYDGEQILSVQRSLRNQLEPLMMWNPPWLLILLGPILCLPWKLAVFSWFTASLLSFVCASYLLIFKLYPPNTRLLSNFTLLLALLSFPPLWACLELGQIGCFLFLGVVLVWYGLKAHKPMLGGLGMVLLSLKPHLFLLVFLIFLFFWIRKVFLSTLFYTVLFQAFLILLLLVFDSSLISNWLYSATKGDPSGIAVNTSSWIGVTPFSALRSLAWSAESRILLYKLSWLAPCFGLLYLFKEVLAAKSQSVSMARLKDCFPVIVLVSFLTSPFGWFFDLVSIAIIVPYCLWSKFSSMLLWLLFLSGSIHYNSVAKLHHELFWFLPLLALIYFTPGLMRNHHGSS